MFTGAVSGESIAALSLLFAFTIFLLLIVIVLWRLSARLFRFLAAGAGNGTMDAPSVLIGLGIGGFFDFIPRAFLLAGAIGLTVGVYQHINVRFNSPRWWRFLFNTTEHHSVHHSQDYEATRSNYGASWIIFDRLFGTCVDGEAELLGMEGGRRMPINETMTFPFTEGYKSIKSRIRDRRQQPTAIPAE